MKILYILIILILLIFIIIQSISIENFYTSEITILTTHPSNFFFKNTKYIEYNILENMINLISNYEDIPYHIDNISIIIDQLDYYKRIHKLREKEGSGEIKSIKIDNGNFLYISQKVLSEECTLEFENHIIGYITETDLYFINAIINSYRMFKTRIKLIKLNNMVPNLSKVDFLITAILKDSKIYKYILNLNLYVYGFKNIDLNRIKLFYPYVENNITNLQFFFPNSFLKLEKGQTNIPSISVLLIQNLKTIYIEKPLTVENFITRLDIDNTQLDPLYSCYNDRENINKALCNSIYNEIGESKKIYSLWDKECTKNMDCPFYLANKNYPNTRGGCIKTENGKYGKCEMPIGINQLGYRKYDDKDRNKPFCYGEGICEKNRLESDFAFENDIDERKKYKKEIIINM
jgi:hypothetical protein